MSEVPIVWVLAAGAATALFCLGAYTFMMRRRGARHERRDGAVWKRSYHLAAELASGRAIESNSSALCDLVESTSQPVLLASAVAVAVRQQPDAVHPALFVAVNRSGLTNRLRRALRSSDANSKIEVLELVEVLRLHELMADAAMLTRSDDAAIVRAACEAVVQIDPSIGLGILIGLAPKGESWVLDSMGRAADRVRQDGTGPIPLSRAQWQSAPLLAQRAITESALFDRATVAEAVSALIAALDDTSSTRQLAAVTALAGTIEDHPAAQLALAGALGSPDRMVRFATAAALSDSVTGHRILRSAVAAGDDSDAARIAAEILWSERHLSAVHDAVAS